ncbi:MAG: hypothetical protein B6229_08730 [Spirochaetaceae bacterium 4572_7]|nr:MAG: hypothetical protein B6229_08730 [Spirochaetaceae bacterium 4572_7]
MKQGDNNPKIFGIGLNKTGTTTLGVCGKILGYHGKSYDIGLLKDVILNNDFTAIKKVVEKYDLFEDWPWPLIYKELDQMFPGSKFILTVRKNEEIWLNSLKKHSLRTPPITNNCEKLAYGYTYPRGHEKEHLEFYRQHNDSVRSYFKGREQDFIELCWEKGHGWKELCDFLGKDIPNIPFPHKNKGSSARSKRTRFFINYILSIIKS